MSMVAYKAPYLLQIMMDDEPLNPRTDYDNFGHMACWHRRYNLGMNTILRIQTSCSKSW